MPTCWPANAGPRQPIRLNSRTPSRLAQSRLVPRAQYLPHLWFSFTTQMIVTGITYRPATRGAARGRRPPRAGPPSVGAPRLGGEGSGVARSAGLWLAKSPPPATSTFPLDSRVAVWFPRAVFREPVVLQVPAEGF